MALSDQISEIDLANQRTSIFDACRAAGMEISDFEYGSPKLYCPFGEISHSDGGRGKAFRIYPNDNTAYCFACSMFFNPVRLTAMTRDVTEPEAAQILLEISGYVAPDVDSRWKALMEEKPTINTDYMAEALKTFCTRIEPLFEERQFDERVSGTLRRCLELLPRIKSEEDAIKWREKTRSVMRNVLGAPAS